MRTRMKKLVKKLVKKRKTHKKGGKGQLTRRSTEDCPRIQTHQFNHGVGWRERTPQECLEYQKNKPKCPPIQNHHSEWQHTAPGYRDRMDYECKEFLDNQKTPEQRAIEKQVREEEIRKYNEEARKYNEKEKIRVEENRLKRIAQEEENRLKEEQNQENLRMMAANHGNKPLLGNRNEINIRPTNRMLGQYLQEADHENIQSSKTIFGSRKTKFGWPFSKK